MIYIFHRYCYRGGVMAKQKPIKPRLQKLHINIQDSMILKIHGYIIEQRVSLEQVWFCGKNQLITI